MKKILLLTAAPLVLLAGCSSGDEAETAADDNMTTTEVPAEPMGTATDGTMGTGTGTATGTAGTGTTGTGTTGTGTTTGTGSGTGTGTGTNTGTDTGTTPPTDTTDR